MNKFITLIAVLAISIGVMALSCSIGGLSNPPATTSSSPSLYVSPDSSTSPIPILPTETPNNMGDRTTWDAPFTINQNSEGQILRVNVVKFVVTASPNASVTIDDIPAIKDSDGNYYAFLDLVPGKNTIEVKTVAGDSVNSHETIITFSPPLFVYLNNPNVDMNNNDIDYSKVPINITGYVSDPQADVKVNGIPASVNADGSFSLDLPGENTFGPSGGTSLARATATIGNESDSDELNLFIQNGKIGLIPGVSFLKSTQYWLGQIIGNPGESTQITGTLRVLKDVEPGEIVRFDMGEETPGIKVIIDPVKFSIYPNVNYNTPITVRIDKNVAPGYYQSFSLIGSHIGIGPKTIEVAEPNGG